MAKKVLHICYGCSRFLAAKAGELCPECKKARA
jgi:hypothetical protein